jgi:hypothetical protein
MKIHLPKEMLEHEPEIKFFMELMVRKLHTNRHKGFADNTTVGAQFKLLEAEILELKTALEKEGQFEAAVEAADVANVALLLGMRVLHMTRPSFNSERSLSLPMPPAAAPPYAGATSTHVGGKPPEAPRHRMVPHNPPVGGTS